MFKKSIYTLVLVLLAALSTNLYAQNAQEVKYAIMPQSTMQINGNSTLHKWTCNVSKLTGSVELPESIVNNNEFKTGDSFTVTNVTVPVNQIKSTESGSMDKKIYGALKDKKFPEITYTLTSSKVVAASDTAADQYIFDTTGKLTIAGTTKNIEMKLAGKIQKDGSLHFQGKKDMKMTDFNIKPPSALFGTIKSDDEISVSFDIIAAKKMNS